MRSFYGKLVLFGEYSMIFDAAALVVPVKHLTAHWKKCGRGAAHAPGSSNDSLRGFLQYLEQHEELSAKTQTHLFASDLEEGLELASDIPRGVGLGSSGSVVAAVYDRYALRKTADPLALKKLFATMENYFHGSSST